jgi:hypothetical protein
MWHDVSTKLSVCLYTAFHLEIETPLTGRTSVTIMLAPLKIKVSNCLLIRLISLKRSKNYYYHTKMWQINLKSYLHSSQLPKGELENKGKQIKINKIQTKHTNKVICMLWKNNDITIPPLWSSGQSSWLQIQRPGFDSRRYHIFWEVVGLERGPLSLVSTNEELLERKVAAPV